jgi:Tol biopolymer transport system component
MIPKFVRSRLFILCGLIVAAIDAWPQNFEMKFPGAETPGNTPTVFAPGIVSVPKSREGSICFSPDGRELYFTKSDSAGVVYLMQMVFDGTTWSAPTRWEKSGSYGSAEAFITEKGDELYFISNRHAPNAKGSGRVWKSIRTHGQAWSTPEMVRIPVNTDKGLWFPSVSRSKNIFFGATLDSIGNFGKSDIYLFQEGSDKVVNLGKVVNSPSEEWDPFVPPDESYLLFESDRPGGYGGTDIYVSIKRNGAWQTPVNLGPTVNTSAYEVAAKVSPDGRFLFFDRPFKNEQDIHWVSADELKSLLK